MDDLNMLLLKWSAGPNGNEFGAINRLLIYLGDNLYHEYEPTSGPHPDYYQRLKRWLDNVPLEKDKQDLLRIAKKIFYVGREEFNSLYRSAFNNHYTRWLINQESLMLEDREAIKKIETAIDSSWFCPITDSMRINQFYHVNNIQTAHDYRPDFRSLRKFGDVKLIMDYVKKTNIKYLVLLEDFVGSATQSWKPVKFACELDKDLQVLFMPLIICKVGIEKIKKAMRSFSNFTMMPVMIMGEEGFIPKEIENPENMENSIFRKLVEESLPEYKTLKFGFEEMGCMLVMYTNTPTNSLPLIHFESAGKWTPLFKRHHRVKP